ncbi:MAG: GH39 family glycosyl hydrolase [Phycisphaerales bacterium]
MNNAMRIDFAGQQGGFRALHGANIGPLCMNGYIDLSPYHRRIGFPTVRLHDCPYYCWSVVDIPCIFPFFEKDAHDPANYLFPRTDAYIRSILDCGSRIIYRLGVSIEHHEKFRFHTDPPADFDHWADICVQIIRHYNEGWAGGFTHDIHYWEIWNEAENAGGIMWNAPYETYIRFYIQTARRIKAACPGIKIGGPAFNGGILTSRERLRRFLTAIREADAPLDFLSWHVYAEYPSQLTTTARHVRDVLDEFGFTKTESHLNEWNLLPPGNLWGLCREPAYEQEYLRRLKGMEGGSLAASSLIALQDAPVHMANFYEAGNGLWGMFELSGLPAKSYYAFLAFREMLDHTPVRVRVEGSEPDQGLAILAGKNSAGTCLQIMASNRHAPCGGFDLQVTGLPRDTNWRVEHRRLDTHSNLECVNVAEFAPSGGNLHLDAIPQSVHLLTFTAGGSIPCDVIR